MLDAKTRAVIDGLAWDCTVGCGEAAEKPARKHWQRLAELLPEASLIEAGPAFLLAWRRHVVAMGQPPATPEVRYADPRLPSRGQP